MRTEKKGSHFVFGRRAERALAFFVCLFKKMGFKSSVRWLFCFVFFFRWLITFITFLRASTTPQKIKNHCTIMPTPRPHSYLLPSRPHPIAARRSRLLPPPNPTEGPPAPGQGAMGAEEKRAHVPLPGPARPPPVLLRKTSTSQSFLPSPASCSLRPAPSPNPQPRLRVPATLL